MWKFTATSAIEDVLIACLIEEDEYDGKKVLCTLRSIIAVTEGHDSFKRLRNTLGTRARYEWVIQQHASENDVALKKRVIDFCGRYLNAARHGAAALETYHLQQDAQCYQEIPVWQDQEVLENESAAPALASFGSSSIGHPLFPFNPAAIGQLVERHCKVKEQGLVFIPRNILHEILREPLKSIARIIWTGSSRHHNLLRLYVTRHYSRGYAWKASASLSGLIHCWLFGGGE